MPILSPEVDAYIAAVQPESARESLDYLRKIIHDEAPDAVECISYGMPGYKLKGYLCGFAAFKNHCSLFPGGRVELFLDKLGGYKVSKGTIQFPHGHFIPEPLIREIVRTCVEANAAKKR